MLCMLSFWVKYFMPVIMVSHIMDGEGLPEKLQNAVHDFYLKANQ